MSYLLEKDKLNDMAKRGISFFWEDELALPEKKSEEKTIVSSGMLQLLFEKLNEKEKKRFLEWIKNNYIKK